MTIVLGLVAASWMRCRRLSATTLVFCKFCECATNADVSLFQVRGVAVPLCAAFAIPDHILRAPIGLATGQEDQYGAYLAAIGWGPIAA